MSEVGQLCKAIMRAEQRKITINIYHICIANKIERREIILVQKRQ